jgi:hypothetical protein
MFRELFPRTNGRAANAPVNPADLALLSWLAQDEADKQAHYVQLRRWYDGDHVVPLTDRQKEYLAVDAQFKFAVNYLRLPVDLCVERLTVTGFDGPEGIGGKDGILADWWAANRMDALQAQVHRAAARDGDTYILVEWDEENGRPVFYHEPAYDGEEGAKIHYLSNMKREVTAASKRWTERRFNERDELVTTLRLNLYKPEQIEKYIETGRGWQPFNEPGQPWPLPWEPGITPMIHFRWQDSGNNWGESELEPLVPLQMMINKTVLDEAEAADKTAAQLITLTGAKWPEGVTVRAGDVLSVSTAEASFGSIPPGDLSGLRARINDYIVRMAQVAHIPLQYFQLTGAIASADTQAADDSQLTAKVRSQSTALGNAWEDVMRVALRLNAVYGDGRDLPAGEDIATVWADFERVDQLAVEQRRAEIVATLINAGISLPGALARVGYPEEDVELMMQGDVVTGIEQ